MTSNRYGLGRNDRITIDGVHYRPQGKQGRVHLLRHVVADAVLDDAVKPLTDDELAGLVDGKLVRIETGYFSVAYRLLARRADGTDLSDLHDLDDDALRTIAWKVEWCTRFNRALAGLDGHARKWGKTPDDLAAFIAAEREPMHRWYVETFGVSRPPGRKYAGGRRKTFDWPGSTTLRGWIALLEAGGGQPGCSACNTPTAATGTRSTLAPRASSGSTWTCTRREPASSRARSTPTSRPTC